jgi:hypothetical protein
MSSRAPFVQHAQPRGLGGVVDTACTLTCSSSERPAVARRRAAVGCCQSHRFKSPARRPSCVRQRRSAPRPYPSSPRGCVAAPCRAPRARRCGCPQSGNSIKSRHTGGRLSAPSGQVRTLPETPPSPPRRLVVVRAATRRGGEGRTWVSELAGERWVRQCAARRRVVGMRVTSDMHSLPVSSSWLRATPAIELGRSRGECRASAGAGRSWM